MLGEDAVRLLAMLAMYQRYERANSCLALIASEELGPTIAKAVSAVLLRLADPAEAAACAAAASGAGYGAPNGAASGGNSGGGVVLGALGGAWTLSLARTIDWTARMFTLEDYLPESLTSQLSGGRALKTNATPLAAVLVVCWEWM
eukprot:3767717-Pleurochrysis_carterae.AAC.1